MSNSTRHKEKQRRRAKQKAKQPPNNLTTAQKTALRAKKSGGFISKFKSLFGGKK